MRWTVIAVLVSGPLPASQPRDGLLKLKRALERALSENDEGGSGPKRVSAHNSLRSATICLEASRVSLLIGRPIDDALDYAHHALSLLAEHFMLL